MCVAIPGRVIRIGERTDVSIPGLVEFPQGRREVDLIMTPDVRVGDEVVIHSGYAIRIVAASDELGWMGPD